MEGIQNKQKATWKYLGQTTAWRRVTCVCEGQVSEDFANGRPRATLKQYTVGLGLLS
jgi:hypothetical protein